MADRLRVAAVPLRAFDRTARAAAIEESKAGTEEQRFGRTEEQLLASRGWKGLNDFRSNRIASVERQQEGGCPAVLLQ